MNLSISRGGHKYFKLKQSPHSPEAFKEIFLKSLEEHNYIIHIYTDGPKDDCTVDENS